MNMADLFRKDMGKFVSKAQEFIDKYGSREFDRHLNYLFEGKYNKLIYKWIIQNIPLLKSGAINIILFTFSSISI